MAAALLVPVACEVLAKLLQSPPAGDRNYGQHQYESKHLKAQLEQLQREKTERSMEEHMRRMNEQCQRHQDKVGKVLEVSKRDVS